jgi:hypothetical protein
MGSPKRREFRLPFAFPSKVHSTSLQNKQRRLSGVPDTPPDEAPTLASRGIDNLANQASRRSLRPWWECNVVLEGEHREKAAYAFTYILPITNGNFDSEVVSVV